MYFLRDGACHALHDGKEAFCVCVQKIRLEGWTRAAVSVLTVIPLRALLAGAAHRPRTNCRRHRNFGSFERVLECTFAVNILQKLSDVDLKGLGRYSRRRSFSSCVCGRYRARTQGYRRGLRGTYSADTGNPCLSPKGPVDTHLKGRKAQQG